MQTTQCPRCRHNFLSYASECPECGLKRPRDNRSKWGPTTAAIISVIALGATAMMVKHIMDEGEELPQRGRSAVQSVSGAAARRTAPAVAQTTAEKR